MVQLVLASTSPWRRELLSRLGVPFATAAPGVDEGAFAPGDDPAGLPVTLARAKALAVAAAQPTALVLGSDQIALLDREVLGKPGSAAAACAQLQRLQGRPHRLVTAVAIARGGAIVTEFAVTTVLHMRPLTRAEIERYVALDTPLDCAGSYRIERAGIALFDAIDCSDQTAIVGLPLLQLAAALRGLGVPVP